MFVAEISRNIFYGRACPFLCRKSYLTPWFKVPL